MSGRRLGVVMLRRSKPLYLGCVDILLTAGLRLTTKGDHNGIRIRQTKADRGSGDAPGERRLATPWAYLRSMGSVCR